MSGRESPGSEDQPRLPDRALRPPVWMPGTALTELHTGDGQELNDGIPSPTTLKDKKVPPTANNKSPKLAQGEGRCWADPTPRAPM